MAKKKGDISRKAQQRWLAAAKAKYKEAKRSASQHAKNMAGWRKQSQREISKMAVIEMSINSNGNRKRKGENISENERR
jgi:hypothetical protein